MGPASVLIHWILLSVASGFGGSVLSAEIRSHQAEVHTDGSCHTFAAGHNTEASTKIFLLEVSPFSLVNIEKDHGKMSTSEDTKSGFEHVRSETAMQ